MAEGRGTAWIQVFGVVAAALITAGAAMWMQQPAAPRPLAPVPDADPGVSTGVMGQLEIGVNRQGMDFDAYGIRAGNAAICAEQCRTNAACRAMTFVVSTGICWLKAGVPGALPPGGPDYVSSVKQ